MTDKRYWTNEKKEEHYRKYLICYNGYKNFSLAFLFTYLFLVFISVFSYYDAVNTSTLIKSIPANTLASNSTYSALVNQLQINANQDVFLSLACILSAVIGIYLVLILYAIYVIALGYYSLPYPVSIGIAIKNIVNKKINTEDYFLLHNSSSIRSDTQTLSRTLEAEIGLRELPDIKEGFIKLKLLQRSFYRYIYLLNKTEFNKIKQEITNVADDLEEFYIPKFLIDINLLEKKYESNVPEQFKSMSMKSKISSAMMEFIDKNHNVLLVLISLLQIAITILGIIYLKQLL